MYAASGGPTSGSAGHPTSKPARVSSAERSDGEIGSPRFIEVPGPPGDGDRLGLRPGGGLTDPPPKRSRRPGGPRLAAPAIAASAISAATAIKSARRAGRRVHIRGSYHLAGPLGMVSRAVVGGIASILVRIVCARSSPPAAGTAVGQAITGSIRRSAAMSSSSGRRWSGCSSIRVPSIQLGQRFAETSESARGPRLDCPTGDADRLGRLGL